MRDCFLIASDGLEKYQMKLCAIRPGKFALSKSLSRVINVAPKTMAVAAIMESGSLRFVDRLNAMVFCFIASVNGMTVRSDKNRKIIDSAAESSFENDNNSNSVITLIWIAVSVGKLLKSGNPSRLSRNPMIMFESGTMLPLIAHLPDGFYGVAGKKTAVLQRASQAFERTPTLSHSFRGFGGGFIFKNDGNLRHTSGNFPWNIKIHPPVSGNFNSLLYRHKDNNSKSTDKLQDIIGELK
jgi:hypothetical protein